MIIKTSEKDEYYFHEGCFILELLNDPNDPEASIARARVEPGRETDLHALKGTTERYLILNGNGTVTVNNEAQAVSQGHTVVIPAGVSQKIENTGSEDLIFLAICTPRFVPECYVDLTSQK